MVTPTDCCCADGPLMFTDAVHFSCQPDLVLACIMQTVRVNNAAGAIGAPIASQIGNCVVAALPTAIDARSDPARDVSCRRRLQTGRQIILKRHREDFAEWRRRVHRI